MERNWEAIWQRLGTNDGIQNLRVIILDHGYRLRGAALLSPPSNMQVPNFTVHLPWIRDFDPDLCLQSDEGHAYSIQRPIEGRFYSQPMLVYIHKALPSKAARTSIRQCNRNGRDWIRWLRKIKLE
jgi:hypothetical protein